MHCIIKLCVTAGPVQRSLVETLRVRGSTDACEFYAVAMRLCRDTGLFPNCVS